MAKISGKKLISWKTYVIPLFIITTLFALIGYIIISLVSKFFFDHMTHDAMSLANNHSNIYFTGLSRMAGYYRLCYI